MTTTRRTLPADFTTILPTLCWDQLATAYEILNERARLATTPAARTRAMNLREAVADVVSARGLVIRSNRHYGDHSMDESEVRYMCGRPADFQPIAA